MSIPIANWEDELASAERELRQSRKVLFVGEPEAGTYYALRALHFRSDRTLVPASIAPAEPFKTLYFLEAIESHFDLVPVTPNVTIASDNTQLTIQGSSITTVVESVEPSFVSRLAAIKRSIGTSRLLFEFPDLHRLEPDQWPALSHIVAAVMASASAAIVATFEGDRSLVDRLNHRHLHIPIVYLPPIPMATLEKCLEAVRLPHPWTPLTVVASLKLQHHDPPPAGIVQALVAMLAGAEPPR